MIAIYAMPVVPSRREKGDFKLTILLAGLFLISCSHISSMNKSSTADSIQPLPDFASGSEHADRQWTSYMRDENGAEYFYDKETISQPSKGILRMWRKREFPSVAAQKEIVTLDEIDCREAQYRTLGLRVTYSDGRVQISDKATRWSKIYENSVEEYLMEEHCAPNPTP